MVNRHGSKTVVFAFSNSKLFADFVRCRKTNNKKRKGETDEKRETKQKRKNKTVKNEQNAGRTNTVSCTRHVDQYHSKIIGIRDAK